MVDVPQDELARAKQGVLQIMAHAIDCDKGRMHRPRVQRGANVAQQSGTSTTELKKHISSSEIWAKRLDRTKPALREKPHTGYLKVTNPYQASEEAVERAVAALEEEGLIELRPSGRAEKSARYGITAKGARSIGEETLAIAIDEGWNVGQFMTAIREEQASSSPTVMVGGVNPESTLEPGTGKDVLRN